MKIRLSFCLSPRLYGVRHLSELEDEDSGDWEPFGRRLPELDPREM
jgi:hypothetical protein